jgi:uncharacterized protein YabE (DUF348 family)
MNAPPNVAVRHLTAWWPVLLVGLLFAALSWGYLATRKTITLVIDGQAHIVRVHAATPGDLVAELGISFREGDAIEPAWASSLVDGAKVRLQHAGEVVVLADGREQRLRSHALPAAQIVAAAGVDLQREDRIYVNGRAWSPQARVPLQPTRLSAWPPSDDDRRPRQGRAYAQEPAAAAQSAVAWAWQAEWIIQVRRAVPITVLDGGVTAQLHVSAPTVQSALTEAGLSLLPEDDTSPPRHTPLSAGMRIRVRRATPVVVEVDGGVRHARVLAHNVGAALAALGVSLGHADRLTPEPNTELSDGTHIRVVRIREDVVVERVAIPYDTQVQRDASMIRYQRRVVQPGQPGRKLVTARVTYEDGREVHRQVISEVRESDPVTEIVVRGTQPLVWSDLPSGGAPQEYVRVLRMYATSYTAASAGKPVGSPGFGITATGLRLRTGIVAVDPRVIQLGTRLYIPGYGYALAADTGGAIKGNIIDLGFSDGEYRSWHNWVDVYVLP